METIKNIHNKVLLAKLYKITLSLIYLSILCYLLFGIYLRTLAYDVPSGDDTALHAYFTKLVMANPKIIISRVYYPSLYHLGLAFITWILRLQVDNIPKVIGIVTFLIAIIGQLLYLLFFKKIFNNYSSIMITIITFDILSGKILQTLNDGSVVEFFVLFFILPLSLFSILKGRYLIAGIIAGLSWSCNITGALFATPILFISVINNVLLEKKNRIKKVVIFIMGFFTGSSVSIYKITKILLYALKQNSNLSGRSSPVFMDFSSISCYMFPYSKYTFYIILYMAMVVMFIVILLKKQLLWIPASYFMLLYLISTQSIPVLFSFQYRLARDMAFFGSFIVGLLIDALLEIYNKYFILKIKIKVNKKTIRIGNISLYTIFFVVLIICYIWYSNLKFFEETVTNYAMIRADKNNLETYMIINSFLNDQINIRNITIIGVGQISSWMIFYNTIPERDIEVFLIVPRSLSSLGAPKDQRIIKNNEIVDALMVKNNNFMNISSKYNIAIIVVESPKKSQWYGSEVVQLSRILMKKNFKKYNFDLLYAKYSNEYEVKVWINLNIFCKNKNS